MWYFYPSNTKRNFKLLDLQGDHPPLEFPRLVEYPYLPMRKSLTAAGLLTVMIFFQSKTFTACEIEKEQTILYFLMVFHLLKIIHPFESKKH